MRIGITGHQRLESDHSWEWVRHELRTVFACNSSADFEAFSSLAIGADQEFANIAVEVGVPLHAVIPCADYESTFAIRDSLIRYQYLLSKAARVDLLDYPCPSEEAFMAAGKAVADQVDRLIAVWDGKPAAGTGGTGDAVAYALNRGLPVVHINPVTKIVESLSAE